MDQQTTLPAFSLYNLGTQCSKGCYQSANLIIMCNIAGPYFERSKMSVQPTINCSIAGSKLREEELGSLSHKIKQVMAQSILKDKYLRMNFDICFQVVEMKNQQQLFPALINLLCFTCVLAGLEIRSIFACSQVWLSDEKPAWQATSAAGAKKMCMVLQSSQKQILYSHLEGQFLFVHFQKLSNLLMDANEQICNYILRKIGQINEGLSS